MPKASGKVMWMQGQTRMQDRLARLAAAGAFETCRVKNGKVLSLMAHWKRLCASLKTLGIPVTNAQEILKTLRVEAVTLKNGYMRVGALGRKNLQWVVHKQEGIPYTPEQRQAGVAIRTVPTRWPLGDPSIAQAKGAERLSGILARQEGQGAFEILRMNQAGLLTEGTVSNVFCVKAGVLKTPPTFSGALEGVSRTRVLLAAKRLGICVEEVPLTRHDIFNAQEAFLTNVLMVLMPVHTFDGRRVGAQVPGPVTQRLMQSLNKYC